ncbi:unnamed protein product, partial [Ectocarpus fasciculatus]
QSVLFSALLRKERDEQNTSGTWSSIDAFIASLRVVQALMKRLLQLQPPELSFADVIMIGEFLRAASKTPLAELELLAGYFSGGVIMKAVKDSVSTVLGVVAFIVPVNDLVAGSGTTASILERYGFLCALPDSKDKQFVELTELSVSLSDPQVLGGWTVGKCEAALSKLGSLLCPGIDVDSVDIALGMLSLFQNLATAEKLWEFMYCHQEYVADNGTGCSAVFNAKLEDFLSQLTQEDCRVLEILRPAVQWVSVLVFHRKKTFQELMATLCASPSVLEQIKRPLSSKPFSQLNTAEKNMDFVSNLFQKGINALDAVLWQFRCMSTCCVYWFDMERAQLRFTYSDTMKQYAVELSELEVRDFEQRLGFVQHEERVEQGDVESCLALLQRYRSLLGDMCELKALGHRTWSVPLVAFVSVVIEEEQLQNLQSVCSHWKLVLEDTHRLNPVLRLFSSSVAQWMYRLVREKENEKKKCQLALLIYSLFRPDEKCFDLLRGVVNTFVNKDLLTAADTQWPEQVSDMLQRVLETMSQKGFPALLLDPQRRSSPSQHGPVRYSSQPSHLSILKLLTTIYSDRPPQAYEILWCNSSTSALELEGFLSRVGSHPTGYFTLLQVDRLAPLLQQIVLRLFLDIRDPADSDCRPNFSLHCVETGPSVLQSISWVSSLKAEELTASISDDDLREKLRWWVNGDGSGHGVQTNIKCYTGPTGCGKTYQMRKYLESLKGYEPGTVSITEAFSLSSTIARMHKIVEDATERNVAIAFQINIGKFKVSDERKYLLLMEKISSFFVKLFIVRYVEDPESGVVFSIPLGTNMRFCVELPDRSGHLEATTSSAPLLDELPLLLLVTDIVNAADCCFDVSDDAKLVCKYLKAYQNGSIDALYGSSGGGAKNVIFVLDNSGSMQGRPLESCKQCLLSDIFVSCVRPHDAVGLIVFNSAIDINSPLNTWTATHRRHVESTLRGVQSGGGTKMWTAINIAIQNLQCHSGEGTKWIVALTDGATGDAQLAPTIAAKLRSGTGADIKVLFISVGLQLGFEETIRSTCLRSAGDAIIRADSSSGSLIQAWSEVGERLTVSEKIEKDGADLTSDGCRQLLKKYMKIDGVNRKWSRLAQAYWIKYLYRRCGILAASEKFNKNKDMPKFGSTTMTIMLAEVEHALADNGHADWNSVNHEQLVYSREFVDCDGTAVEDYKWGILASYPDGSGDPTWRERMKLLEGVGMSVPSETDLARSDIKVLESYLARGIGIKIEGAKQEYTARGKPFDFNIGRLPIMDKKQFIITLDFTLKMLCINERVECGVPCIMEGETGVSKTALTRMLFYMKNTEDRQISPMVQSIYEASQMCDSTDISIRELNALRKIAVLWECEEVNMDEAVWRNSDELVRHLCQHCPDVVRDALLLELKSDPGLDPLLDLSAEDIISGAEDLLKWFIGVKLTESSSIVNHWSFHAIDVHSALTPEDIADDPVIGLAQVVARATRISTLGELLDSEGHKKAMICVFFDEVNTSSCMGVFKEVLCDHSLNGELLPSNIVFVAACNPSRDKIGVAGDRRRELGNEWAIGHYQVHPLPQSLRQMTWDYGSLNSVQEREFIDKKLRVIVLSGKFQDVNIELLSTLVYKSQELIRSFAKDHIRALLSAKSGMGSITEAEVEARAGASVSLRDVLRVFKLFSYFLSTSGELEQVFLGSGQSDKQRCHKALVLAVVVVYYLRLGSDGNDFRQKFRMRLQNQCGRDEVSMETGLVEAMDALMKQTLLDSGIANTRGLQENIFMIVVCCLAGVPLMIVGPPGSSKTLAVTIVAENARGEYSQSRFYRAAPQLIPFRYQCSRSSTSHQIKAVFDRAIDRQARANKDGGNIRCFVFMDEAGLPEEERESLKVLHYYLESHMMVAAEVGFVAITNHILDAAKSNRCALLMRAKPDHEELMSIARGCLGTDYERSDMISTVPGFRRGKAVNLKLDPSSLDSSQLGLMDMLCETFYACMNESPRIYAVSNDVQPPAQFVEFLGNRDFMGFMKKLGELTKADPSGQLSTDKVVEALERNMNGVEPSQLKSLIDYFLLPTIDPELRSTLPSRVLRNPVDLIRTAMFEHQNASAPSGRYLLIVDTSSNDSILRVLGTMLRTGNNSLLSLKLSDFSDDGTIKQVHVISRVKWAAEKGQVVMLSHTEAINESFYDLFNQHFRRFEQQSGDEIEVVYHTNIAVGSDSRRCKVTPGFHCVVHITLEELQTTPAPFLNRFEKYRLTHADLLNSNLHRSGILLLFPALNDVLRNSKLFQHIYSLIYRVNPRSFYGYAAQQTVESAILRELSSWCSVDVVTGKVVNALEEYGFRKAVIEELRGTDKALQYIQGFSEDPVRFVSVLNCPVGEEEHRVSGVMLAHLLLRGVVGQLMSIVAAEQIFQRGGDGLPLDLLRSYLGRTECFSLNDLLKSIATSSSRKHMAFVRTSAAILSIQAGLESSVDNIPDDTRVFPPGARLLVFAQYVREAQFLIDIQSFFDDSDPHDVLVILIDGSRTVVSQVNFARHVIDELTGSDGGQKSVVLLVHVPPSDLRVHHFCDTTFDDWQSTFLNGVDASNSVEWLELSLGEVDFQLKWDFQTVLEKWLSESMKNIARCVVVPNEVICGGSFAGTMIQKRLQCFAFILRTPVGSSTIKDILLSRYIKIWREEDGTYPLLVEHARESIAALAAGESFGTLSDLHADARQMFTNYMCRMLVIVLEDYSVSIFLSSHETPNVEVKSVFSQCLNAVSLPLISELWAPPVLLPVTVRSGLIQSGSIFPFFWRLSKSIRAAAAEVLALNADYEDACWETMSRQAVELVRDSAPHDELATVATNIFFDGSMSEGVWLVYLSHFVSSLSFVKEAAGSLQHRMITEWLNAHEGVVRSQYKVASLHLVSCWHDKLLASLAVSVAPLGEVLLNDEFCDRVLAVIGGEDDVSARLTDALVSVFYGLMLHVAAGESTVAEVLSWEKAFTASRLSETVISTRGS